MSRSARIRKKSAKFADFESPDDIEGLYKKKGSPSKTQSKVNPSKIEESDSDSSDTDDSDSDIDVKGDFDEEWGENVDPGELSDDFKYDDFDNEGDLQVDMPTRITSKRGSNFSQAKSLYFSEKKKPSLKDLMNPKKKKVERKDKGKTRLTAYMLWARATRPKIVADNPMMDFPAVNKRLGESWNLVPYTQKLNWQRKAKKLENRTETPKSGNTMISTGKATKNPGTSSAPNKSKKPVANSNKNRTPVSPSNKSRTPVAYSNKSPTKASARGQPLSPNTANIQKQSYQSQKKASPQNVSEVSAPVTFKVTGTSPIDVAAHLKLLGESLNNIGQRLKEHEGQIAVSGSLSVLLDSMLCVLGPLACLSNQVEVTRGAISDQTLSSILDNIAYIMPGIV